jgi:hypothetical protein
MATSIGSDNQRRLAAMSAGIDDIVEQGVRDEAT